MINIVNFYLNVKKKHWRMQALIVCFNLPYRAPFCLKGLFHPAFLARAVSWLAFVVAIFMAHENGDKQRPAKRRHVQEMLDETDPLSHAV